MMTPLVALDVGSTKVACAIGLPHEHAPGVELLGSSIVPYPVALETWLGDPLMVSRAIEQAIAATSVGGALERAVVAFSHPLLSGEEVAVGIPLGDEPVTVRAQDLDRLQQRALDHLLGIDREPLLVEPLGYSGNGFSGMRDPVGLPATRPV